MSYSKGDKPVLARLAKKISQQIATRSQSAPSIVNLGSSQVKFETQVKTAIVSPRKEKRDATDVDMVAQEELLLLNYEDLQVCPLYGEGVTL